MRVKVHPHRDMVLSGREDCISVTPVKKGGRAHYAGTIVLSDVEFRVHSSGVERARRQKRRNVHAWAIGDVLEENVCQHPLTQATARHMLKVTYHYVIGRFYTIVAERNGFVCYGDDVTDERFPHLYAVGKDFWVPK